MIIEQSNRRVSLRKFIPRFTLRALLIAVVLIAVALRVGQWAWPKYLIYRQGREYAGLQATKEPFVEQQRRRHAEDKAKDPNVMTSAVDDSRPIPDDFVILVRQGNTFGCFIPRNQGKQGESLEYDWYFRTDGLGRFPSDSTQVQSGHSFAGPYTTGNPVKIKFGPFDVEWSGSFVNWGYLYLKMPATKPPPPSDVGDNTATPREYEPAAADHLRLCTTNIKTVELLDARDPNWIYIAYPGDTGVPGNVDLIPSPSETDKRRSFDE